MSPSTRRVWIEIWLQEIIDTYTDASPSTRRVWIEIPHNNIIVNSFCVTLHPEGVD